VTRRSRSDVERRLSELESRRSEDTAPLAVSYHPVVDEYWDGDGNVVDPKKCDPLVIIATDEQIDREVRSEAPSK
jgi:hypothetical protein